MSHAWCINALILLIFKNYLKTRTIRNFFVVLLPPCGEWWFT